MAIDSLSSLSGFPSLTVGQPRKTLASKAATSAGPGDFTSVLSDLAKQTASTIKASEATAMKGIQGQAAVQDVVQAVIQAQTSLQAALALRDKTVSAYQDLIKMPI